MSGINNNRSTPLIVAATNIKSADDADVYLAMLKVADWHTLMTATNDGEGTSRMQHWLPAVASWVYTCM
jgi:hypothetical protein